MNEDILQQILTEVTGIKTEITGMKAEITGMKATQNLMQTQLNETNQIVHAIRDRQDETDAKLDALSLDVHSLHGEVASIKDTIEGMKGDIEFIYQKTSRNELEIFRLLREKEE